MFLTIRDIQFQGFEKASLRRAELLSPGKSEYYRARL